ncbi:MAG: hypothetical protein AAFW87_06755 [Pseudomonadota bacterium]
MTEFYAPRLVSWIIGLVATGLLAFYCHRMVLLRETHPWVGTFSHLKTPIVGPGPFLLRFLVVGVILIGFAVVLAWLTGRLQEDMQNALLLSLLVPYGAFLALFGTLFPAAAVGGDASLSAAFARGKASFGRTLLRLIMGPLVFSVVTTIIFAIFEQAILRLALEGGLGATGLTLGIRSLELCRMLALSFTTLLVATALGLAYEENEAP